MSEKQPEPISLREAGAQALGDIVTDILPKSVLSMYIADGLIALDNMFQFFGFPGMASSFRGTSGRYIN